MEIKKWQLELTFSTLHSVSDSEWEVLRNAWREQNDAGNGDTFDFDGADGTVTDVIDHPEVILLAERGQQAIIQIATAHDPERVLMACDANGPWLCDVTSTWRQMVA